MGVFIEPNLEECIFPLGNVNVWLSQVGGGISVWKEKASKSVHSIIVAKSQNQEQGGSGTCCYREEEVLPIRVEGVREGGHSPPSQLHSVGNQKAVRKLELFSQAAQLRKMGLLSEQ